jgi:hypothetical protein
LTPNGLLLERSVHATWSVDSMTGASRSHEVDKRLDLVACPACGLSVFVTVASLERRFSTAQRGAGQQDNRPLTIA